MRASNVQIPVSLLEPLLTRCTAEGRSHGEMIIHALENTHQLLPTLLHPATTGGSLFGARASRATRSADGPFTPLGYRLRNADYRVLDELVTDLGASSRGHLISVALSAYLDIPT